jgi:NADH-quinone oxidoreductase subunit E
MTQKLSKIDRIIAKYQADRSALIQILLEIQRENRWLPRPALMRVSQRLGIPINQIYQIATFYKAFSLIPQGRHSVSVCLGTACHVRGAPRLLDRVTDAIHIGAEETSADMKFGLSTVNCLGCCALGPVMVVDGEYHGNPSTKEIVSIISSCD